MWRQLIFRLVIILNYVKMRMRFSVLFTSWSQLFSSSRSRPRCSPSTCKGSFHSWKMFEMWKSCHWKLLHIFTNSDFTYIVPVMGLLQLTSLYVIMSLVLRWMKVSWTEERIAARGYSVPLTDCRSSWAIIKKFMYYYILLFELIKNKPGSHGESH